MGVSVMQLIAPLAISVLFSRPLAAVALSRRMVLPLSAERRLDLVPFLVAFTLAAWFFMNDLSASKASLSEQLPVLKRGHLWVMALLYLATFGSFYRLLCGLRDAVENAVPGDSESCTLPSSGRYSVPCAFAGRHGL